MTTRCGWSEANPVMIAYHDQEWGVPVHDDRKHFEFLLLDAFQAGVSWSIVLNKRENFRQAFDGFDPAQIARYRESKVNALLQDAGIIRNRGKIAAAIANARAFLEVQEREGSFDRFIWRFVGGATKHTGRKTLRQIPARTRESDRMSTALKELGFKFVGSTICYAYMQAAGLVNDHLVSCFRYPQVREIARSRGPAPSLGDGDPRVTSGSEHA
ncbi:MAG TPA: DNA-3-methyladenine glycosylase I [Myxococcaceae bacterium]|nr:DNA-3-methyladenine glycosylase I [Myxococcaceae bacterium]